MATNRLMTSSLSFLFLLFLSVSQAYAYLPVNLNATLSIGATHTVRDILCSTAPDGKIYCNAIIQMGSGNGRIYSWNETGGNRTYCTLANSYTIYGGIMNSTHAYVVHGAYALLYDISGIRAGTCTNLGQADNLGHEDTQYYVRGAISGNDLYIGSGRYNFTGTLLDNPYWETAYQNANDTAMLPNISTNSTIVGTYTGSNPYFKYVSGVGSNIAPPELLWNVGGTPSLFKVNASTTWLYLYAGSGSTAQLYRVNFSQGETVGEGTILTNVAPINSTEIDNPLTLHSFLDSANNGTLRYYLNGTLIFSQTVNNTTTTDYYALTPKLTTEGTYVWTSIFTDSLGYTWNAGNGNQSFYWSLNPTSTKYLFAHPLDYLNYRIGAFFSVSDLATSRNIASILYSALFSLIVVGFVSHLGSKKLEATAVMLAFCIMFLGWLTIFTLLTWFPAWAYVVIIVLSAFAFTKMGPIGK